jgi:hypothetical protein
MKFRELAEASPASINRTLKSINRLNDEIEQVREKGTLLLHVLRDITPQLPDDVANVLSDFLQKPHIYGPGSDQRAIATAVAERAIELGIVNTYKEKQVEKLDKDKMKFDYDKEVEEF